MVNAGRGSVRVKEARLDVGSGGVRPRVAETPGILGESGAGLHRENPVIRAKSASIIVSVHFPAELQLLEIAPAIDASSLLLGAGQGREKQGGQDGDDRDHNQQFYQGKSPSPPQSCDWATVVKPPCFFAVTAHWAVEALLIAARREKSQQNRLQRLSEN